MEFTEHEKKLIAKLQYEKDNFKKNRIYLIYLGTLTLICAFMTRYYFEKYIATYPPTSTNLTLYDIYISSILFSFMFPTFLLSLTFSGICFGKAIYHWHGNPRSLLILKILHKEQTDNKEQTTNTST